MFRSCIYLFIFIFSTFFIIKIFVYVIFFVLYFVNVYSQLIAGISSVASSTMDVIIVIFKSFEFPSDQLFVDVTRVLKPGGAVLLKPTSLPASETTVSWF